MRLLPFAGCRRARGRLRAGLLLFRLSAGLRDHGPRRGRRRGALDAGAPGDGNFSLDQRDDVHDGSLDAGSLRCPRRGLRTAGGFAGRPVSLSVPGAQSGRAVATRTTAGGNRVGVASPRRGRGRSVDRLGSGRGLRLFGCLRGAGRRSRLLRSRLRRTGRGHDRPLARGDRKITDDRRARRLGAVVARARAGDRPFGSGAGRGDRRDCVRRPPARAGGRANRARRPCRTGMCKRLRATTDRRKSSRHETKRRLSARRRLEPGWRIGGARIGAGQRRIAGAADRAGPRRTPYQGPLPAAGGPRRGRILASGARRGLAARSCSTPGAAGSMPV